MVGWGVSSHQKNSTVESLSSEGYRRVKKPCPRSVLVPAEVTLFRGCWRREKGKKRKEVCRWLAFGSIHRPSPWKGQIPDLGEWGKGRSEWSVVRVTVGASTRGLNGDTTVGKVVQCRERHEHMDT